MLLHKMKAFAIYLLAVNSCLSQEQHSLNQDSLNVLRNLCPYNDFCQSPATQIMDDKTHSPCCRHCSCDKDCEQLQSCCPDNESHSEDLVDTLDTMKLTCKNVAVGWTKQSINRIDGGLGTKYPHFLIIDQCPVEEKDDELRQKCSSTAITKFDGFLWVSDMSTGQIFQNQYCASCHSVSDFVYWKVGIKNCTYPFDDSLPIESILQTNNCYLVLEEPSNMQSLTTKYRCFLADISQCNKTGIWTQFNETISTDCNNFDMPFITELADGTINAVCKNVFCFLCNSPSGNRVFDVCSAGSFRFDMTTVSFIGVIDYNQWLHEKKYEKKCNFYEIFDHVLDRCHRIYCQLGWTPSGGECFRNHLTNPRSSIEVIYKMKLSLPSPAVAVDKSFSEIVRNRIETDGITFLSGAFGYEEIGCKPCIQELFHGRYKHDETIGNFYLYNKVTTYSKCDLETLRVHMISFLDTSLVLDSDLRFVFQFESLFKGNLTDIQVDKHGNHATIGHIAKPFICAYRQRLTSNRICPRIILDHSDIVSLPSGKTRAELLASLKNSNDELELPASLEICINDYFNLLSRVNTGFVDKQENMLIHVSTVTTTLMIISNLL